MRAQPLAGILSADSRCVGFALDTSGALFVADGVGNTVWRVGARP